MRLTGTVPNPAGGRAAKFREAWWEAGRIKVSGKPAAPGSDPELPGTKTGSGRSFSGVKRKRNRLSGT
jgi:hypothetical protein